MFGYDGIAPATLADMRAQSSYEHFFGFIFFGWSVYICGVFFVNVERTEVVCKCSLWLELFVDKLFFFLRSLFTEMG